MTKVLQLATVSNILEELYYIIISEIFFNDTGFCENLFFYRKNIYFRKIRSFQISITFLKANSYRNHKELDITIGINQH